MMVIKRITVSEFIFTLVRVSHFGENTSVLESTVSYWNFESSARVKPFLL